MHNFSRSIIAAALLVLSLFSRPAAADEITVFAAASLTNAMGDVCRAFEAKEKHSVSLSFASSSTLAKQIENGAPANLFLSADLAWMDYLDQRKLIVEKSRTNLLGNRLVLIAPVASRIGKVDLKPGVDLTALLSGGLLACGDPDHVPAGKYARSALENLGIWKPLEAHIARANDVRAALALVERAECPLGVVYATDAAASSKVKLVGVFPESSHPAIIYPAALVKGNDTPEAQSLFKFLQSPVPKPIFEKYGFTVK
jgi:molybdate transport system substrate-binding protein